MTRDAAAKRATVPTMSQSSDPAPEAPSGPVEPVPAATVMLVRDTPAGVEVFMMERSAVGPFGGLHVFPGGKLDPEDHAASWNGHVLGVGEAVANATLRIAAGGLGHWIACLRECFEEAGVLLAVNPAGDTLPLRDPARRARFEGWRERLNAGDAAIFRAMCREESLRLAADQLAYVAHWITPIDQPRRFDTRFFVARAPHEQEALHDGFEAVESAWMRPEDALDRFAEGELNLISPTEQNLRALCGHRDTDALLEAKRAIDPATIPTILPRVIPQGGGRFEEVLEVVEPAGSERS